MYLVDLYIPCITHAQWILYWQLRLIAHWNIEIDFFFERPLANDRKQYVCATWAVLFFKIKLKSLGFLCTTQKHKRLQTDNKFTQFEDNDGRKVFPLKYYLLRCCSFWGTSKTIFSLTYFLPQWNENCFSMYNGLTRLSWKHCSVIFTFFLLKNLTTIEAVTCKGRL